MHHKVITAVATEPITTAEAKLHLRVDHADDDALIGALITAAREFAEHYTGRALAPQTLEAALDAFPDEGFIDLPMPPVASVTSIKYTDTAGAEQTVSSGNYALSTYGESRRVNLSADAQWPTDAEEVADAVRIRYVAGYATCPKAARQAMLLLIGHLYENRQAATALKVEVIPMGARALLDTIKVWGF